jgi:hypothetical protein
MWLIILLFNTADLAPYITVPVVDYYYLRIIMKSVILLFNTADLAPYITVPVVDYYYLRIIMLVLFKFFI